MAMGFVPPPPPPPPKFLVLVLVLVVVSVSAGVVVVQAQQAYVNNHQLACYDQAFNSTTKGYVCNGARSSCPSYITFRSFPPYNSPVLIAYLLGLQDQSSAASLIASINNISSDTASIPDNTLLVVPVNCSCFARQYYQHNASYTLKYPNETYLIVANNTYQGLTTCQALMAQNPYGDRNLTVGLHLQVPLRCACPTSNQTAIGAKYLLTYMVFWGDSMSAIAQLFGVQQQTLLDANQLSSSSTIFPFTPILVPLTTEPTKVDPSALSPPAAAAPPQAPIVPAGGSSSPSSSRSRRHWIYVGVAIGVVIFVVTGFLLGWCWYRKPPKPASTSMITKTTTTYSVPAPFADSSNSWSLSSHAIRGAVESLTVYRMEDLQEATAHFSQANRIKGSVYRGYFKGDAAAVKVLKGDVSAEINILKMINHSNIIRLSGFCLHKGNTYLVYEYAESGSLSDCLHSFSNKYKTHPLSWKQRVQIAHDVADALNYLHSYTNPPYIHKNLKTTNILLDANLRAKVANFGLARMLETYDNGNSNGGLQLTRHVVGTQGYLAPEYIENGLITPKLDVFAFGVVLLELLSGKEAAAETDQLLHATISPVLEGDNVREKLHAFLDPRLEEEYPLDLAFSMAQLANTCVAQNLNTRPSMSQVLMTLSKILSSSLDWDPSNELGRSTSLTHSSGR